MKRLDKTWLREHLTDPYVKLAQKEGYRSRAAYKLKEIDETLRLIQPGQRVIDLGAAPGAWSQYLRRRLAGKAGVAPSGVLIAIDLLDVEPIDGVQFVQGDFHDASLHTRLESLLAGQPVDLVLSDMAPNLSGIASADAARMADLVHAALEFALHHLQPRGALVAKAFHGSGYGQLARRFKDSFEVVKSIKPKASRSKSAETFLYGRGPKRPAALHASPQASAKRPERVS